MSGITKLFGEKKVDTEGAKFDPYSISGPGGSVSFDRGSKTATSSLSPELQSFFDDYLRGSRDALGDTYLPKLGEEIGEYGRGLFEDATTRDMDEMVRDRYNRELRLLAPERALEDVALAERLYGTGRSGTGMSIGTDGYLNPESFSRDLAREQANLGLFRDIDLNLRNEKNQDIQTAIGYRGLENEFKYSPFTQSSNLLGMGVNLMGVNDPYLGYGIQAGQASAMGGANAAKIQQQGNANRLGFFGSMIGGGLSGYFGK